MALGLKAALFHPPYEELLWAAAAIGLASLAGATMAVWRRQEGWAFSAALGVNVAASLVVWHYYCQHGYEFQQWWLRLVQANVIASAVVALLWLAVRRRLYQLRELTLAQSPLLAAQTAIPIVGNFILLLVPVVWLLSTPAHLTGWQTDWMTRLAELPGWLGLLLTAAAAAWYLRQALPGSLLHVPAGLGLGAGVLLAACAAKYSADFQARFDWGQWLEYHTLTAAWTAVGALVLALGWFARNLRLSAEQTIRHSSLDISHFRSLVQSWVSAIGIFVFALAVIHAGGDPEGPWWSAGAILSVSVMAGVIAMWLRRPD